MPNNANKPSVGLRFTNIAPDDKEWTAHINILNEWGNPDRTLRDIIQYARSGSFYPADMHVDLIQQWYTHQRSTLLETIQQDVLVGGLPRQITVDKPRKPIRYIGRAVLHESDEGFNEAIRQTAATQQEKMRVLKEELL